MSADWFGDMVAMHDHYGFGERVERLTPHELWELLKFRRDFLHEELREMGSCMIDGDAEGVVDALVDLCVVAIGTLELFEVDGRAAWDEVLRANMSKEVGIKASRPNPLGLPDLVKPEGWEGPSHGDNHGLLNDATQIPLKGGSS